MQRSLSNLSAIALGLILAWPAAGQDAAPQQDAPPPGPEATTTPAPDVEDQDAPATEPAAAAPNEAEAAPQDTPEPRAADAPDSVPPAQADPSPATSASPGPTAAQPAEQATVRETFGDWEVQCATGTDECVLHQVGLDEDENPVIEFSLLRVPEGNEAAALVNVLSPLGTFLPAGITMQIDQGQTRQYGFTYCSGIGCVAQIALTEESVAAMRRGRTATLSLASVAAPDQPVELRLSLTGFTDAWNSLTPRPVSAPALAPEASETAPSSAPTLAPTLPPAQ
jgi:invasion protein IalB